MDCLFEYALPANSDRKSESVICKHGTSLSIDAVRRALLLPRLDDLDFRAMNRRIRDGRNAAGTTPNPRASNGSSHGATRTAPSG